MPDSEGNPQILLFRTLIARETKRLPVAAADPRIWQSFRPQHQADNEVLAPDIGARLTLPRYLQLCYGSLQCRSRLPLAATASLQVHAAQHNTGKLDFCLRTGEFSKDMIR